MEAMDDLWLYVDDGTIGLSVTESDRLLASVDRPSRSQLRLGDTDFVDSGLRSDAFRTWEKR